MTIVSVSFFSVYPLFLSPSFSFHILVVVLYQVIQQIDRWIAIMRTTITEWIYINKNQHFLNKNFSKPEIKDQNQHGIN